MLKQKGYTVYYTPCAEIVHLGSQSINQDALGSLRDQCLALIEFNEAYDYFGKSLIGKWIVRMAIMARYYLKVVEFYVSSDKRVIKGPGAPSKEQAERAAGMRHLP